MESSYTTNRFLLKVLTSNDASKVLDFYINNKEHFIRWEPSKVNTFYTTTYQAVVLSFEYSKFLSKDLLRLWIFDKTDPDQILGTISLTNIQHGISQSCILGYKLDKDFVGKGYMTECLQKVIEIAFQTLDLHRIEALVMPANIPSIRLLERFGFQKEGLSYKIYKINNEWEDHYRYSLINN